MAPDVTHTLETPRLILLPASPEAILALIDQPDRFTAVTGVFAADGLRGFFVSAEVAPVCLPRCASRQVRIRGGTGSLSF